MSDKPLSPDQFQFRVATIIIGVGTFNILLMELLVICIMGPTPREVITVLASPLPVAIPLLTVHILVSLRYLRPVRQFLQNTAEGIESTPELVKTAEDRIINLAYFLSLLSFPAYILGGVFGYGLMIRALPGWPLHLMAYGLPAGIIAGLLTIPMSEHFSAWAVRPGLNLILSRNDGLPRSRSAGFPMPLRRKFVLIVVVMVAGFTGYTLIIGYRLADSVVDNMTRMETLLPAETVRQLAHGSQGTADNRVKSSAYFNSRKGSINVLLVGIMAVGTLLALGVSLAAARTLTRPLHLFEAVAEKIRSGKYDEKISIITNDEFAHLGISINRMTDKLLSQIRKNGELLNSIREAIETLSPMSTQLVAIADQQASGIEQQASAAEEAAAMGRTIAGVSRRIAENMIRISRNSEKTREITLEGQHRLLETENTLAEISARMKDIVLAMAQLEQQSQEIDEIVQTIKSISAKTNILSINAGIEAIKAGDNGIRFGVVAREIRLLAQDSRQSALRITENIEHIRQSLDASVVFVEDGEHTVTAGRTIMTEMTDHFSRILNANMNAARELRHIEDIMAHQATTNRQLSDIIDQIKNGTRETNAAAEKTHSTLKALERLVAQLQLSFKF